MIEAVLDTDIVSEFFRGNTKVIERAGSYLEKYDKINVSIISYYEILNGLLYKDAKKQLIKFQQFIDLNTVVPLTIESVKISAALQANLRIKGIEIGHTDTLIAGIAIANNLQLVTNNTKHFTRVEGLELANWTK